MAFACVLLQEIDGAGLEASRFGVYWQPKRGHDSLICELKIRVA